MAVPVTKPGVDSRTLTRCVSHPMAPDPPSHRIGIAGQFGWMSHTNWGHGMIRKATVAVVVLFLLLAIVASRVPSEWAMVSIAGVGVLTLAGYLFFISRFALE